MSAGARLDAATVRALTADMRRGAQVTREDAVVLGDVDGSRRRRLALAGSLDRLAQLYDELAAKSEAQPPRLSDWIRTCEGTGLGEPEWSTDPQDPQAITARLERAVSVRLSLWRPPIQHAQPCVNGLYVGITCSTPAELRAALESLARP